MSPASQCVDVRFCTISPDPQERLGCKQGALVTFPAIISVKMSTSEISRFFFLVVSYFSGKRWTGQDAFAGGLYVTH